MSESQVNVPLSVRLRFGHAAVQYLADEIGVDLLHIKGVAVDPSLRPSTSFGTDVDIIVRPGHVPQLDRALTDNGWRLYSTFEYGSPLGHAQTYTHDSWGYIDIHRFFPGIRLEPGAAFARMWSSHTKSQIAGVGCPVPSVPTQALLLILNAARAGPRIHPDLTTAWYAASDDRRAEIRSLVDTLDAGIAFAAAIGELEQYRAERDYRLWKVISEGGTRSEEWRARISAAPNLTAALRIIARAPRVNVDHLAHRIGRRPTRLEIMGEFFARPARAATESWRALRRRRVSR